MVSMPTSSPFSVTGSALRPLCCSMRRPSLKRSACEEMVGTFVFVLSEAYPTLVSGNGHPIHDFASSLFAMSQMSTNSDLRGPRVDSLPVDFRHRAQVIFGVLAHPRVVDLGDRRGYGQRILELPPQLQGVVEVL